MLHYYKLVGMAIKELELFKKILADNKASYTKSRELVFISLITPEPQTMQQLIERLEGKVDKVSIYRNVELFEELGLIHRVNIGWKYKLELSDQFLDHHHHLNCLSCGKSIDIEDEAHINDFINKISDKHGFSVKRHLFEIDGFCKECSVKT